MRMLSVVMFVLAITVYGLAAVAQPHQAEAGPADEAQATLSADQLGDGWLGPHEASRGKYVVLCIGFGLALAVAVGAVSQSRVASSALDGLARNPGSSEKVFLPFILGMVLIESLVIYALVVSLLLLGYLGG